MGLPHDDGWAIPFDSPYYPPLPAHYRGVWFQFVFFEADPDAVSRFLPDPLQASPDGLCGAVGIKVPFSSAYGAFNEAGLMLRCSFRGQAGWYWSHVWHDGPAGIAAGREIYGTPKIFTSLDIRKSERTMFTQGVMGEVPVVTISSTIEDLVAEDVLPSMSPAWRLKIIPRADGPGPAIKQLIDGTAASLDLKMGPVYRGRGTVAFEPSPLCDVTALRPRSFGDAYYFEADYSEGYATIAHDYLADTSP